MADITLLTKVIKESVELGKVVNDKLGDGYQWTDLIPISLEAKDLIFIFNQWAEIKEEVKDLDNDEIKQLIEELVADLGITKAEVVALIEAIVAWGDATYEVIVAFKAMKAASADTEAASDVAAPEADSTTTEESTGE